MHDSVNTTSGETIGVKTTSVVCDGGVGPLGHPRVYLKITGTQILCPYCSRLYILEPGSVDDGH